jgi:fatty acid-binding protein DegV
MYIHVGEQSFRDGVELNRQEFYRRLPEFKPAPTTAAPGPEIFRQVYEQLAAEGAMEILFIHISVKLSAVCTRSRWRLRLSL